MQYPREVWTHVDGDIWDIEVKYFPVRGRTRQECEDNKSAVLASHDAYVKLIQTPGQQPITFEQWKRRNPVPVSEVTIVDEVEPPAPTSPVQSTTPTLDVVAAKYMSTKGRYDRTGAWVPLASSYVTRGKVYIRSFGTLVSKSMDQLTRFDVDTWFSQYQQSHSQNTAYRFRGWLVPVGDYAVEMAYWSKNHFRALPKISAQRQDDKPTLSFDDIDKLWRAACTEPQIAALFVLLRFGLRIGEALGLTADCINDDGTIHIKYNLSETPNDGTIQSKSKMLPFLGTTKTRASTSKIHIPKHWIPILRTSLDKSKPMLIQAHDDKKFGLRSHNFVINNKFGQCWRDENVKRGVQKIMQQAQVTIDAKSHSLGHTPLHHIWRYTYCSELVAMGANDVEIMSLMRHTDSNLSKEVYAQVRLEDKQLYDHYRKQVKSTHGYNLVIAQMDEDRRAGIVPLVAKAASTPAVAPLTFSIPPGTALPSLPKPKKGLGGFIGSDGSVKVDI
jgi:integrase